MTRLEFDWDSAKARSNRAKHGVSFDEAVAVFADPLALSRLDDHGVVEERWVTLGRNTPARLLLVVHTYVELNQDRTAVRIISARPATLREARQYEEEMET